MMRRAWTARTAARSSPAMGSPFPGDPVLDSLRDDLKEKRHEAQTRWAAFEGAREAVKTSNPDEAKVKHAHELHKRYEQASAEAHDAEEKLVKQLDKGGSN